MNQVCFPFRNSSCFSELQEVEVAIFTPIVKIPNFSIIAFIGVYGPKFTKFSKVVNHVRVSTMKDLRGELQKNLKFSHLYTLKRSLCLHPEVKGQGQRPFSSDSTAVLNVQKFASVPELKAPNYRHHSKFFSF